MGNKGFHSHATDFGAGGNEGSHSSEKEKMEFMQRNSFHKALLIQDKSKHEILR